MEKDYDILIVDDKKENHILISKFLVKKGYRIASALNGFEAIDFLKDHKTELILMDILMPGMTGYELCVKIKKNGGTKDIPVIFLTSKRETEDLVQGFEAGAVDYITKPFNHNELYVRVNNHIQLKKAREYLKEKLEMNKGSGDEYMNMLMDLGKILENGNQLL